MRVVLANVQAPFIRGGAEYLAESLQTKLRERGHRTELVRIPFNWQPPSNIPKHILACRLLKIEVAEPDLVIAFKFPAYVLPFPNKKLWLLHQFRQVYELWDTVYQDLPNTPEGHCIRDMIIRADNVYLREAAAIYTNSHIVANRLQTYNGIQANGILYPPLLHPERLYAGDYGNYFFYPSRVVASKRQALAIEAMRLVKSEFTLVLAGQPETAEYGQYLEQLVQRHGLADRVKMLGWISEEEKARLMAEAVAALYIPYDEDSYGFVTLEAFHSQKAVITCTDSGGTDELIEDRFNGLNVEPTPEGLAAAMEYIWGDKQRARVMGGNANQTLGLKHISWDYVLDNLLS